MEYVSLPKVPGGQVVTAWRFVKVWCHSMPARLSVGQKSSSFAPSGISAQYAIFQNCDVLVTFLLPWVPEVFLACDGNFRCWPNMTETGNRARKDSGTQGTFLFVYFIYSKTMCRRFSFITSFLVILHE